MKLTSILLLVACLQVSAGGVAQVSVTCKDAPLKEVLISVRKQTNYLIFYSDNALKDAKPVTLNVKNQPVDHVLKLVFDKQPLGYRIENKTIFIISKVNNSLQQQQKPQTSTLTILPPIDVSGRVLNEQGKPVEGVTVTIRGTNKSTFTNANGEFFLNSVEQDAVLVFTSVNMETFELKVSGKTELVVNIKAKVTELGNVEVINNGYQQISKERATGSYTKVDSGLYHRQISTDMLSRLDGITQGLFFDKTGGVKNSQLLVRGVSTLGKWEPLIILDNFRYYGDINNINPNDVESITLLKDAAAASIWGSNNAGNGVIVITTKKGKYNRPPSVTATSNVTFEEKPDLYYFPQMTSSEFIDVEQFLFRNGFHDADLNNTFSWPLVSPVVELLEKERQGALSPSELAAQIDELRKQDVREDFKNHVYRNAINLQNYLSLSGGSNGLSYRLSLGYDRNISNIIGPGRFDRYTINSNLTSKPFRFLELNTGIYFNQSVTRNDGLGYPIVPGRGKSNLYPYARLIDDSGNHMAVPRDFRLAFVDTLSDPQLMDWHYRPLDEAQFADNSHRNQNVLINVGANVKFTSWLNADLKYQFGNQTGISRNHRSIESFAARSLINQYYNPLGTNAAEKYPIAIGGILNIMNNTLHTHNLRGQINFKKTWLADHDLTALLAAEIGEARAKSESHGIYGYDPEILAYSANTDYNTLFPLYFGGSGRIPGYISLEENVNRSVSFLGNISYSYKSRYTLYASARRDGSNLFGAKTNNKWKPLWSAGASWEISKEGFWNQEWLPLLRLRTSYGYTGNINNNIPAVTTIVYSSFLNPLTNTPVANIGNPPNPGLRWEEVRILNFGVDFSMFKNGISGTVELFRKNSNDVIAAFPTDPTQGLSSAYIHRNAANLKTKGLEVTINTTNINTKVQWTSTFNFSYVKTVVTRYFQNFVTTPLYPSIREDQVYGGLYAYRWGGLDPATGDPQGYLGKQLSKDYSSIILLDSFQNQVFKGSALPLYFGNFLNNISWKNFALSFNITCRLAYYFRKPTISYENLYMAWQGHSDYSLRWQKPGDESHTTVPSMIYPNVQYRDQFYAFAEPNVEKGDHIRINDARLSYNWENRRSTIPVKSIQFYLYANNLNVIIWKASKSDFNPDFSTLLLPPSRTWAVGCSINF